MTILSQALAKLTRIAILASVIAITSACTPNLSQRIGQQVQKSGNFDLAQLAPFPWDSVSIYPPYAGRAQICPTLPASWAACQSELPEYIDEADHLMIFISNGKVSQFELVNRTSGDFMDDALNQPIPRAKARFSAHLMPGADQQFRRYQFKLMQP